MLWKSWSLLWPGFGDLISIVTFGHQSTVILHTQILGPHSFPVIETSYITNS
ncbi:hypothetical protein ACE6H2_028436 [Prunus campanulata]